MKHLGKAENELWSKCFLVPQNNRLCHVHIIAHSTIWFELEDQRATHPMQQQNHADSLHHMYKRVWARNCGDDSHCTCNQLYLTWELSQPIDDLSPSRLHAHRILADHQCKHYESKDLACIRLEGEWGKSWNGFLQSISLMFTHPYFIYYPLLNWRVQIHTGLNIEWEHEKN